MMKSKQVEDTDFHWPEPLVIDIVSERYPDVAAWPERMMLARLQAQALFEVYAGRDRPAAAARLELIAFCAARDIGPERIARVDVAVFKELAHLATARCRTSPRTAESILRKLETALERVCPAAPRRPPTPYRAAPGLRAAIG